MRYDTIKIPLGMEVGIGPGDTTLDGDPDPPRKGSPQPPNTFRSLRMQAGQPASLNRCPCLYGEMTAHMSNC